MTSIEQLIQEKLNELKVDYVNLTIRSIDSGRVFVVINGWNPNPAWNSNDKKIWNEIDKLARENNFSITAGLSGV